MTVEELPEGTRFTDVLEAIQAAWLARNFEVARDLTQRYIDPIGEFCCMRCTAMREEPWKVNCDLGAFFVCPECAEVASRPGELLGRGGEVFMTGPAQKITKTHRFGYSTKIEETSQQTRITVNGHAPDGSPRGFLIAAIGAAIKRDGT